MILVPVAALAEPFGEYAVRTFLPCVVSAGRDQLGECRVVVSADRDQLAYAGSKFLVTEILLKNLRGQKFLLTGIPVSFWGICGVVVSADWDPFGECRVVVCCMSCSWPTMEQLMHVMYMHRAMGC